MHRSLVKPEEFIPLPSHPARSGRASIASFGEDCAQWAESPARLLHEKLVATFSPPASSVVEETLSARKKLALVVGSSAMLWIVILMAGFVII